MTSVNLELEKTYLAAYLPDLPGVSPMALEDVYIPDDESVHPRLRIRRLGNRFELTKKFRVDGSDASRQSEMTIPLDEAEYLALAGDHRRRVTKLRYRMGIDGHEAEVDVFRGPLAGLVLIDFEFASERTMASFEPPAVCLAEVTQEDFLAGGLLAGRSYADIAADLDRFGYRHLVSEGST